jgi:hypothetical protein
MTCRRGSVVEHTLGKGGVESSILSGGTSNYVFSAEFTFINFSNHGIKIQKRVDVMFTGSLGNSQTLKISSVTVNF